MSATELLLEPFPGTPVPDGGAVAATARRVGALLELRWQLRGPAAALAIPPLADRPERRRELWEQT
ncbi:MAG: hypothetical protein KGR26_08820, partial [Cyanobacteria bacterium REEB65]|nr:hypothetical protein [Cyanobacteria bacterium REEB65]